jgi:hypothetical protein
VKHKIEHVGGEANKSQKIEHVGEDANMSVRRQKKVKTATYLTAVVLVYQHEPDYAHQLPAIILRGPAPLFIQIIQ